MDTATTPTDDRGCEHGELWLAKNDRWYCVLCDPPRFEAEVVERRQVLEALRLFELEDRDRGRAA